MSPVFPHWSAIGLALLAIFGACGPGPQDDALAVAEASSQTADLPRAAEAFPRGLSGELVFQSDVEGRPKIYKLDLATGRIVRLTEGPLWRDENPRWSPDASRIAFKSNRAHYGSGAESGTPDYDLYLMNPDGTNIRRITSDPGNEHDLAWAPDGRSLFFSSDRDGRGDLYRVWLEDGRIERLTRHFVGRAIMPAPSPDGARVAFAAQTLRIGQFWVFQIHLLDLATGRTTALPKSGGSCWPSWAPDGKQLAYVLLDEEPSALEAIEESGKTRRLVNDAKLWSYYPDWSRDGQRIAFSVSPEHHEGEDWDLALLDPGAPGRFVKLTTGPGNDRLPDWKP
jgi:TolB protein